MSRLVPFLALALVLGLPVLPAAANPVRAPKANNRGPDVAKARAKQAEASLRAKARSRMFAPQFGLHRGRRAFQAHARFEQNRAKTPRATTPRAKDRRRTGSKDRRGGAVIQKRDPEARTARGLRARLGGFFRGIRPRFSRRSVEAPPDHPLRRFRRSLATAHGRLARGELERAARDLGYMPESAKLRRAQRRQVRKLASATYREARTQTDRRSKRADAVGTYDAVMGLRQLKSDGRLGWFQRWRARRAESRAIRRALAKTRRGIFARIFSHADHAGAVEQAYDQLLLVARLRGANHPSVVEAAKDLYTRSLKVARRAANDGDVDSTGAALQIAAQLPERMRDDTFDARSEQLVELASRNAVTKLINQAHQLRKRGDAEGAARALFYSLDLQRQYGFEPKSRRARKRQARLRRDLGPHLAALERQTRMGEEVPPPPPPDPGWNAVDTMTGGALR